MKTLKRYFAAALTVLRGVAALFDARDWHFYGGLALAYAGARAVHPAYALLGVGVVLMGVGLLYRGRA
ncbi:MAG: hypothetical protein C0503_00830 [Gemmatimonas sp.]|nr:hypothetical protein [Gemmatimonas sp.]